jgi:hypothetical protein
VATLAKHAFPITPSLLNSSAPQGNTLLDGKHTRKEGNPSLINSLGANAWLNGGSRLDPAAIEIP